VANGVDVVVVGGGTAGCVLAARLSEDAERSVVLVEAGPDHQGIGGLPEDLRSAQGPSYAHDWGFRSDATNGRRSLRLPRAMVIGGCSATNAAVAVRGAPSDYDAWRDLGVSGWSWADVLPWFVRLECDMDFDDDWHGATGPVPIRRYRQDELSPVQRAVLEGAGQAGHPVIDDHNRPAAVGAGHAPTNAVDGVRISTAMAYLWPVAHRRNLTVRPREAVRRVTVVGGRATGVELASGEHIDATTVVVAAGAYCSPAILLRSGIGATDDLRRVGIDTRIDLPGVGEHLQDHPIVPLSWAAPSDACGGPTFQSLVTLSPDHGGAPRLQLVPASAGVPPTGQSTSPWYLTAAILKPSSVGRVRLDTDDPFGTLHIDTGHLADEADVDLLREAVAAARSVAATDALGPLTSDGELSGLPVVDADEFSAEARRRVTTYHHPVGTCRMGDDPARAVVDSEGRVHHTSNLFVADASAIPLIPSANTNVPTIMVAERIADSLRRG
jgi:choline dehydrogenase